MAKVTYTITLEDGTEISNLTLNGNNYISPVKVTEETFSGKLGAVTITDSDGNSDARKNLELVQISKIGTKYWFVLRELSTNEVATAKTRCDIDYIAMMANIDLEEV
ncbi:hypothetical protein [Clostridium vitabionis]|uniref:hypothetical protein n=1 Tax=Clostridium vitabionis TaxID=2784388 RepID=UPI00188A917D|nr:hypothetical protein [Clostridium vitabionis]